VVLFVAFTLVDVMHGSKATAPASLPPPPPAAPAARGGAPEEDDLPPGWGVADENGVIITPTRCNILEGDRDPRCPITSVDIGLVFGALVCEFIVMLHLFRSAGRGRGKVGRKWIAICFLADIGFTLGKLDVARYNCDTFSCAKVTHNCVMTIAGSVMSALEHHFFVEYAFRRTRETYSMSAKSVEYVLAFSYVIYDAVSKDPPGSGTTFLVVLACLAEVVLIFLEIRMYYRYGNAVSDDDE
jgi:hypothetical protein